MYGGSDKEFLRIIQGHYYSMFLQTECSPVVRLRLESKTQPLAAVQYENQVLLLCDPVHKGEI
jgi:hypothetical protein